MWDEEPPITGKELNRDTETFLRSESTFFPKDLHLVLETSSKALI